MPSGFIYEHILDYVPGENFDAPWRSDARIKLLLILSMKRIMQKETEKGIAMLSIVIIIAIVVVGGGAVAYTTMMSPEGSNDNEKTATGETGEEASQNTETNAGVSNEASGGEAFDGTAVAVVAALKAGESLTCTYSDEKEGTRGTFYAEDGEIAVDFTAKQNGKVHSGHTLTKEGKTYMWSDTEAKGMIVNITYEDYVDNTETADQKNVDLTNENYNYDCDFGNVDNSVFAVPANIEFRSVADMMPEGMSAEMQAQVQAQMQKMGQ